MSKSPDFPLVMINTKFLTYHGEDGLLTGELSELEAQFGNHFLRRVYNDAADIGCYVVSHRTGRQVLFVLTNDHYSKEGELLAVELEPTEEVGITKMLLFND